MRRRVRLLALLAFGIGAGATWRWLRGPDTPLFREPWPADKPWPPIGIDG